MQKNQFTLPFDLGKIKAEVYSLIPNNFPQKQFTEGTVIIRSYWKKGTLTKMELDNLDITGRIRKEEVQTTFENILKRGKRFRHEYTGKLSLTLTIRESDIREIYYEAGNKLIDSYEKRERR
jgi:hypothetical protein